VDVDRRRRDDWLCGALAHGTEGGVFNVLIGASVW
jgi:hypothetical protein